jgi:hypothetical protein
LNQRRENESWISPLLERLNLMREREENLSRSAYWKQIEECELVERIGRLIVDVNRAAGYHILEMVDFLPPQKNVLRVSFHRARVKHNLEFVIRDSGIVLMFSTTRHDSTGWRRYVSTRPKKSDSTLVWEQAIQPEGILDQNIQAWISYLLSGLDKKFRLDQILHAPQSLDAGLNAALRKASA